MDDRRDPTREAAHVPALSAERALPVETVAEILAGPRLGCLAPIGAGVLLAVGLVLAVTGRVQLSPSTVYAFVFALIGGTFAWIGVPWIVQQRRAVGQLRELGLTPRQIVHVRRIAGPIVRRRSGMDRAATEKEIAEAIAASLEERQR